MVGVYFVRYNVSDSWENAAEEVVRTVRVLPEDALSCQLQEWEFTALLSNEGPEYFTYDNFSGLTAPIGGVRWWGMSVDSGLDGCARDPSDFEIIFYEDNNGVRGDVVYSEVFEDLTGTPTGEEVEGLSVVEYAVTLDGCAALHEGWISIRGVEDEDCYFVWLPSAYGDGRIRMEGLGCVAVSGPRHRRDRKVSSSRHRYELAESIGDLTVSGVGGSGGPPTTQTKRQWTPITRRRAVPARSRGVWLTFEKAPHPGDRSPLQGFLRDVPLTQR